MPSFNILYFPISCPFYFWFCDPFLFHNLIILFVGIAGGCILGLSDCCNDLPLSPSWYVCKTCCCGHLSIFLAFQLQKLKTMISPSHQVLNSATCRKQGREIIEDSKLLIFKLDVVQKYRCDSGFHNKKHKLFFPNKLSIRKIPDPGKFYTNKNNNYICFRS